MTKKIVASRTKLSSRWGRKGSNPMSKTMVMWFILIGLGLCLFIMRQTLLNSQDDSIEAILRGLTITQEVMTKGHTSRNRNKKKRSKLQRQSKNGLLDKPHEDNVLYTQPWGFVHLGKCGGVSLARTLRGYFGYQTRLGHASVRAKWYHLSKPALDKADNWLLLVRDPIARIQSWWMYDHIDNFPYRRDYWGFPYRSELWPKLFECYPTLDDFCSNGLVEASPTTPLTECQLLAYMAIPPTNSSYLTGLQHVRFNFFQYFVPLLQTEVDKKNIYVVRSEEMLDDLNSINEMLGDSRSIPGVEHVSHWRSENYPMKDRRISRKGMVNLCRQLCNEIQIYKQILERALNLNDDVRENSYTKLARSCPIQAKADTCPALFFPEDRMKKLSDKDLGQIWRDKKAQMNEIAHPKPRMSKPARINKVFHPDSEETFGFVPLGRCGGHTVRAMLLAHQDSSKLSQKLISTLQSESIPPLHEPLWATHRNWVVLVRDPIDRFKSWWAYHHPDNLAKRPDHDEQNTKPEHLRGELKKLYDCFPTLQGLIFRGIGGSVQSDVCRRIAGRVIAPMGGTGVIPSMHDTVDFSYLSIDKEVRIDPDSRILLVVRAEHMVSDLNNIESMLSPNRERMFLREQAIEYQPQSSSDGWPVSSDQAIDPSVMAILCKRLCPHIQTYKFLLWEAINLTNKSYEMSMTKLRLTCPVQADSSKC